MATKTSTKHQCGTCGLNLGSDSPGKSIGCYGCSREFCCYSCLERHEAKSGHGEHQDQGGAR